MKSILPYIYTVVYAIIPGALAYVLKVSHGTLGFFYIIAALVAIIYWTLRSKKVIQQEEF
jgi:hypothetical protein